MLASKFYRFKGVNNQQQAADIQTDELASCVNFLLGDDGVLHARPGMLELFGGSAHSVTAFDGSIYFRSGTSLMRHDAGANAGSSIAVDSNLVGGAQTCYAFAPGMMLYSDGHVCRRIEGGSCSDWGIAPPAFSVSQNGLSSGAIANGPVQVTATYISGRYESGAATPFLIDGGASGVTIDIPPSAAATHKAVYMSMPGGEVLRRVALVPIGAPPFVVSASQSGAELQTLHKTPPPPHSISHVRNGRALVAVNQFLLYSDPFRFDLFDPIRQSIPFPSNVTMLASISAETLVVGTAGGIFRLAGADLDSVSITQISDLGVGLGAYAVVDASVFSGSQGLAVVFAAAGGFGVVGQDGSVSNFTGERFKPDSFSFGSAGALRQPGINSVVFCLHS
jgi:hypothetical protein